MAVEIHYLYIHKKNKKKLDIDIFSHFKLKYKDH